MANRPAILPDEIAKDYYTRVQVEELANLSPAGFRHIRSRGRGPKNSGRFGRLLVYPKKDVHAWLKERITELPEQKMRQGVAPEPLDSGNDTITRLDRPND